LKILGKASEFILALLTGEGDYTDYNALSRRMSFRRYAGGIQLSKEGFLILSKRLEYDLFFIGVSANRADEDRLFSRNFNDPRNPFLLGQIPQR
jgi:hypothetical protein